MLDVAYDPDESSRPWEPAEVFAAVHMRGDARTEIPSVGAAVLYRHNHHGDVVDAVVVSVQPVDDPADPNLWLHDQQGKRIGPHPDPWPLLTVHTPYGLVNTREARVRGASGWLPADWEG